MNAYQWRCYVKSVTLTMLAMLALVGMVLFAVHGANRPVYQPSKQVSAQLCESQDANGNGYLYTAQSC